jgi:hypothetical protein
MLLSFGTDTYEAIRPVTKEITSKPSYGRLPAMRGP